MASKKTSITLPIIDALDAQRSAAAHHKQKREQELDMILNLSLDSPALVKDVDETIKQAIEGGQLSTKYDVTDFDDGKVYILSSFLEVLGYSVGKFAQSQPSGRIFKKKEDRKYILISWNTPELQKELVDQYSPFEKLKVEAAKTRQRAQKDGK